MSRGTKAPFKRYEGAKEKDRHVRLTKSMLDSKAFKSLKYSYMILYIYMKLWACGKIEFDYAKSLGERILSPATVTKAIRELVDKGFIERVHFSNGGGHTPNTYKFSTNWLDYT